MTNMLLDEVGFVFIPADNRPYLCRMWSGHAWLFYWVNDHWVSLREVSQTDIWRFPHNLEPPQQKLYQEKHDEWCTQFDRQEEK